MTSPWITALSSQATCGPNSTTCSGFQPPTRQHTTRKPMGSSSILPPVEGFPHHTGWMNCLLYSSASGQHGEKTQAALLPTLCVALPYASLGSSFLMSHWTCVCPLESPVTPRTVPPPHPIQVAPFQLNARSGRQIKLPIRYQ